MCIRDRYQRRVRETLVNRAMPVGLLEVWLAKKAIVFTAANIYGISRLYRKSLKLNKNWLGDTQTGQHALRHTFDFTAELSRKFAWRCMHKLGPKEEQALQRHLRTIKSKSFYDTDPFGLRH
eukprot:TRINITY_DN56699_c0_g1_i1.p2 TRINITY_DN56699_c0_g1~~TRINITY_DN56699_c0_g1_i1.p2  ORF type:complete len:122 (+),score=31.46 TRINITY_DN56699_c0_g1_i1:167-532(+)